MMVVVGENERADSEPREQLDRATEARDEPKARLRKQGDPKASGVDRFAKGQLDGHEVFWLMLAMELDRVIESELPVRAARVAESERKEQEGEVDSEPWPTFLDFLHWPIRHDIVDPVLAQWNSASSQRMWHPDGDYDGEARQTCMKLITDAKARHATGEVWDQKVRREWRAWKEGR